MPSESDGGNGSSGTSGASGAARGGSEGGGGNRNSEATASTPDAPSAPSTPDSPGWTGNRSERDARAAGNDKAGNADGGPAGFGAEHGPTDPGYVNDNVARISKLAEDNPTVSFDQNKMFGDLSRAEPVSNDRSVSPNGWTYGQVRSLSDQGFGGLTGINANNMTGQNVDNVLASQNMNDNVMPAVAGLITGLVPGAGLALSGVRAAGRLSSGQTTLGDEAKNFAIDYASGKVAGLVNRQVAGVIGRDAYSNLSNASSISKAFGGPGLPNVGATVSNGLLGAAGISKSTGAGFSSQNNPDADNGFTAPGTNYRSGSSGVATPTMATPTVATSTLATPTVAATGIADANIDLWGGIDGAGWRAAKAKYIDNKRT